MHLAVMLIPDALSSTITGPADVLLTAALLGGLNWKLDCVAEQAGTVSCFNGMQLAADISFADDVNYDLILIPSMIVGPQGLLNQYSAGISWLKQQSADGARLASICTGAFMLAETGLLDGREVTTHWAYADIFRHHYPRVLLNEKETLIDNGSVMCCSAGTAWQDLVLHLLRDYVDDAVILQLSEAYQLQRHNTGQQAFSGLPFAVETDPAIEKAKQVLKQHAAEAQVMERAVTASGLNTRTFQRRFKALTQMTAGRYLQLLRIERAKQQLIFTDIGLEQISYGVGYEDASYLRRLFKKETGLSMREYRSRFAAVERG